MTIRTRRRGRRSLAAILVNGGDASLAEAMMVGPIAARLQLPVLLTAADELPSATIDFIEAEDIEHVIIVGGTDSVSADGSRNSADLAADMWITAKGDGAAAGAAGNDWSVTFDRASGYDAAMTEFAVRVTFDACVQTVGDSDVDNVVFAAPSTTVRYEAVTSDASALPQRRRVRHPRVHRLVQPPPPPRPAHRHPQAHHPGRPRDRPLQSNQRSQRRCDTQQTVSTKPGVIQLPTTWASAASRTAHGVVVASR